MSDLSKRRPFRLSIRVSQHEKAVLKRAAGALQTTVSSFVRQRAYADAQAVFAEQDRFRLTEKQWRKSCKALDAPPMNVAGMRVLLTEPGIFDG